MQNIEDMEAFIENNIIIPPADEEPPTVAPETISEATDVKGCICNCLSMVPKKKVRFTKKKMLMESKNIETNLHCNGTLPVAYEDVAVDKQIDIKEEMDETDENMRRLTGWDDVVLSDGEGILDSDDIKAQLHTSIMLPLDNAPGELTDIKEEIDEIDEPHYITPEPQHLTTQAPQPITPQKLLSDNNTCANLNPLTSVPETITGDPDVPKMVCKQPRVIYFNYVTSDQTPVLVPGVLIIDESFWAGQGEQDTPTKVDVIPSVVNTQIYDKGNTSNGQVIPADVSPQSFDEGTSSITEVIPADSNPKIFDEGTSSNTEVVPASVAAPVDIEKQLQYSIIHCEGKKVVATVHHDHDYELPNGEVMANICKQPRYTKTTKSSFNYGSECETDDEQDEDAGILRRPAMAPLPRVAMELCFDTPLDPPDTQHTASSLQAGLYVQRQLNPFKWRPFTVPPTRCRRENFSPTECGPTATSSDAYHIFTLIWDQKFMKKIAFETNRYARELALQAVLDNSFTGSRLSKWRDVHVDELYVYLALVLAMGVVGKTRLEDYWCDNRDPFQTSGFSAYMTLERYQMINSYLHFTNNEALCERDVEDVLKARVYKVMPVLAHLNQKFSTLFNLQQNISLEETLLKWSGEFNYSQPNPTNKAERGITSYAICDSISGYTWRLKVYPHSVAPPCPPAASGSPLLTSRAAAIVLDLVRGLEHRGHTLWMNNYYHSPALARTLKSLGFNCAGTLRTNREHVPPEISRLTAANMRPGQITSCTSGDVDLLVWRDQHRVALISTYHKDTVSRSAGGTTVEPVLLRDYKECMKGRDEKDQILAFYSAQRDTKVWYKKLFRHLLNLSVFNAYTIYKNSNSNIPSVNNHRDFRRYLIATILGKHKYPTFTS